MKRISFTILLAVLMSMVGVRASAHDIEAVNADGVTIYYNFTNGGTELAVTYRGKSNPSEYAGHIVIPESVRYGDKDYPVTSIGSWAFFNCSGLTGVNIPNSVTYIDDYVFSGCSGLTEVNIPNSITSIGNSAFSNCSGLTEVNIPNSITSIGTFAFSNCSGLTEMNIPNSVKKVDEKAFYGCSNLQKVIVKDLAAWCGINFGDMYSNPLYYAPHLYSDEDTEITDLVIPDGVTSIGSYAFSFCKDMTSVTIPNSVTSIGNYAFSGCSGLTEITLPNGVTSIGNYVFSGCSGLTEITLPNRVTSIGGGAFYGCDGLTEVVIPSSVTNIGSKAFANCSGLTKVTIEDGTFPLAFSNNSEPTFSDSPIEQLYLGRTANHGAYSPFSGITSMKSLVIGKYVTSIGAEAFKGCTSLAEVTIEDGTTPLAFASNSRPFGGCPIKKVYLGRNLSVGNSSYSPFREITSMTSLVIGEYVTEIGESAFDRCWGLVELVIPNNVTSIGIAAFWDCDHLNTITIGAGVRSIGGGAFAVASTTMVPEMPAKFIWLPETPPSGYESVLGRAHYVPNDQYTNLKNKTVYPLLNSRFEVDGVRYVPTSLSEQTCDVIDCAYDESAENIRIGGRVTHAGETFTVKQIHPYALYGNNHIRSAEVSLDSDISAYAFSACRNLKDVTIGDGTAAIGDGAFSGCRNLASLSIGFRVKNIGQKALSGCTAMATLASCAITPPLCDTLAMDGLNKSACALSVPQDCATVYQQAEQWKDFSPITGTLSVPEIAITEKKAEVEAVRQTAMTVYEEYMAYYEGDAMAYYQQVADKHAANHTKAAGIRAEIEALESKIAESKMTDEDKTTFSTTLSGIKESLATQETSNDSVLASNQFYDSMQNNLKNITAYHERLDEYKNSIAAAKIGELNTLHATILQDAEETRKSYLEPVISEYVGLKQTEQGLLQIDKELDVVQAALQSCADEAEQIILGILFVEKKDYATALLPTAQEIYEQYLYYYSGEGHEYYSQLRDKLTKNSRRVSDIRMAIDALNRAISNSDLTGETKAFYLASLNELKEQREEPLRNEHYACEDTVSQFSIVDNSHYIDMRAYSNRLTQYKTRIGFVTTLDDLNALITEIEQDMAEAKSSYLEPAISAFEALKKIEPLIDQVSERQTKLQADIQALADEVDAAIFAADKVTATAVYQTAVELYEQYFSYYEGDYQALYQKLADELDVNQTMIQELTDSIEELRQIILGTYMNDQEKSSYLNSLNNLKTSLSYTEPDNRNLIYRIQQDYKDVLKKLEQMTGYHDRLVLHKERLESITNSSEMLSLISAMKADVTEMQKYMDNIIAMYEFLKRYEEKLYEIRRMLNSWQEEYRSYYDKVKAITGISDIVNAATDTVIVYTLDGKHQVMKKADLKLLPKGIYIINGQKVVVK